MVHFEVKNEEEEEEEEEERVFLQKCVPQSPCIWRNHIYKPQKYLVHTLFGEKTLLSKEVFFSFSNHNFN